MNENTGSGEHKMRKYSFLLIAVFALGVMILSLGCHYYDPGHHGYSYNYRSHHYHNYHGHKHYKHHKHGYKY